MKIIIAIYGTGELIRDALEKGCTRFIVGPEGAAQVFARQKGADEDLLMQAGFQSIHTTKPGHITLAEAMQKETAKQHIQSTIKRFLA